MQNSAGILLEFKTKPHCYTLIYFDSDDCCMRDTMAYSTSPASTGLLRHQLAYPL